MSSSTPDPAQPEDPGPQPDRPAPQADPAPQQPMLPPYGRPQQYGPPPRYQQAPQDASPPQYSPSSSPAYPGYPQYQPHPRPETGGHIWLGIILSLGIAIGLPLLFAWGSSVLFGLSGMGLTLSFFVAVALAVVLTCIRSTRRTGIGMWIGIAALPVIGFGTCIVLVFGSSSL